MEKLFSKIFSQIQKDPHSTIAPDDLYGVLYSLMREDGAKHLPKCLDIGNFCDSLLRTNILSDAEMEKYYYLHKNATKLAAPLDFDSYMVYLEWNRDPKKKFYEPRREILRPIVRDLQDLKERKIDFLGVSMPPRTGKSTTGIWFMSWIMGNYPDDASVMTGHSSKLTDGFYQELLSLIGDTNEYLWYDVFQGVNIANKSAQDTTIDLVKAKRFPTVTCRSVGGTLTGAVEVGPNGILYSDDLIEDLEESLNPMRLEAKYDAYLNQLKDRKKEGAGELMIGTRWNIMDPLGRISQQYAGNPRYRFRVLPALDENGQSNFGYKNGVGFSTAYYEDMKASIDDATWCAKYMGKPYVREGLLFPEDELHTYNGVLPDGDPMKIAVCDVAWGGGDSLVTVFLYVYGTSVYVHDVIYNQGDKTVTYPAVIGRAKQHLPAKLRFEANNGGAEYADHVDSELRKSGVHINIFSVRASNQQSKLSRIIQYAPDIKKFYFIADKHRSKEYKAFMTEVTTFVQSGKNLHDDACDALAMAAEELFSGGGSVEVFKRPI